MASKVSKSTKETPKALRMAFEAKAREMIDINYLEGLVAHNVGADINTGDHVISTVLYDSSVFVVPTLYHKTKKDPKTKKPLVEANPYTQKVVDSTALNLTRKARKGEDYREERRIKVHKLSLLDFQFNEQTGEGSYARQSHREIIFREREMNFREEYASHLSFWRNVLKPREGVQYPKEAIEQAPRNIATLEKLMRVPPFKCFYDEKYGFLIKRGIVPQRIVVENLAINNYAGDHMRSVNDFVEDEVKVIEKKHKAIADLKEDIVMEAMKPSRIERRLEEYGDEAFNTFCEF